MNIVTLCTGNVARSVMLGYMLTTLADANGEDWHIRTAGTHVVEGSAISSRTRDALMTIDELGQHNFNRHRSHQLVDDDASWADIILASEVANVNFVRSHFPASAKKCVQLQMFVRDAPPNESMVDQLGHVASRDPDAKFDVIDPAGGDFGVYQECADQLWKLSQAFAVLVGESV